MTTGMIYDLTRDPIILNIALESPSGGYVPTDKFDVYDNLTVRYLRRCKETNRIPLTTNPSLVRAALEAIIIRWDRILGREA